MILDRRLGVLKDRIINFKDLRGGIRRLKCCMDRGIISMRLICGHLVAFLWNMPLGSLILTGKVRYNNFL